MNSWNGLDFFILLILAVNTMMGLSRGATKEIISMMSLSVGLIFAIKFTVPLAAFFNSSPLINDVVNNKITHNFMLAIGAGPLTASLLNQIFYSISLLICFVGAFSTCEAVLSTTGFQEIFPFTFAAINRQLGGTLGFTRGFVFTLILLSIIEIHIFQKQNDLTRGSFFTNLFQAPTIKLDSLISSQQPESYREIYQYKNLYNETQLYKNIKN